MKVVLLQNVKNLGEEGEIKDVADGYARNYLLPKGLAIEATQDKIKEIKERNLKQERKKDKEKAAALQLKEKIDGQTLELTVKTGGGDKLFGAVTGKEITELIQKNLGVTIDKKKIDMKDAIKHIGEYSVKIKIYPTIQADIKLKVLPQ